MVKSPYLLFLPIKKSVVFRYLVKIQNLNVLIAGKTLISTAISSSWKCGSIMIYSFFFFNENRGKVHNNNFFFENEGNELIIFFVNNFLSAVRGPAISFLTSCSLCTWRKSYYLSYPLLQSFHFPPSCFIFSLVLLTSFHNLSTPPVFLDVLCHSLTLLLHSLYFLIQTYWPVLCSL